MESLSLVSCSSVSAIEALKSIAVNEFGLAIEAKLVSSFGLYQPSTLHFDFESKRVIHFVEVRGLALFDRALTH